MSIEEQDLVVFGQFGKSRLNPGTFLSVFGFREVAPRVHIAETREPRLQPRHLAFSCPGLGFLEAFPEFGACGLNGFLGDRELGERLDDATFRLVRADATRLALDKRSVGVQDRRSTLRHRARVIAPLATARALGVAPHPRRDCIFGMPAMVRLSDGRSGVVRKVISTVVGLSVLTLAGFVGPVAAAPGSDSSSGAPSAASPGEIAAFRATFGLNSSSAALQRAALEDFGTSRFGVPLTEQETADLDARFIRERQFGTFVDRVAAASGFGGAFVDQAHGGMWVVGYVGDPSAVTAALKASLPDGVPAITRKVDFDMSALETTRASIDADFVLLSKSFGVSMLGINDQANRVVIGLKDFDPDVAASLATRYGPTVMVQYAPVGELATCTRTNCASPSMKGGLRINSTKSPVESARCTSGFGSHKVVGNQVNKWYMLTAGHCLAHGGSAWLHNFGQFGSAGLFQFCDRCSADTGIITMSSWNTPTNAVFAVDSSDIRTVIGRRSNAAQGIGVGVCRVGASSNNVRCGTIIGRDLTQTFTDPFDQRDYIYNHQWAMNGATQGGDSGGPIIDASRPGTYAFGTIVGGPAGGNTTYYSTVDWIRASIGYEPCDTAILNPCS